jgi:ParB-like chromosome segregation protein Spo0J
MNKKHEVHPVASLFPMMDDVSFQALKEDIKTHGQLEPILYWKKMLVDGRNRLRACEELNIEPREVELMDETDPVAYVISHNLHRRHLTTGQRSDVAAKVATMRHGDVKSQKSDGSKDPSSITDAAKLMKVSPASVKRAKKVHAKGSEAVKKAMADGTLPVTTAAALVDLVPDKEQQTKLMEDGVDTVRDAIKTVAKDDELVFRDVDDDDDDWTANERDRRSLVEKGFSVVANQSKDKSLIAWAHSQGLAVKVDRSSKYGNPFILDQDGDRDEVCDKYEKSYLPIKPSILNDIERLKGKVLICHCYPLRCHGDCLANTANQIENARR